MRTKNTRLDETVKYTTGAIAICKYCRKEITFQDPLRNGFNEWYLPDLTGDGPWWQCMERNSFPKIHEPEEKENNFDKLYKLLKYE